MASSGTRRGWNGAQNPENLPNSPCAFTLHTLLYLHLRLCLHHYRTLPIASTSASSFFCQGPLPLLLPLPLPFFLHVP